MKAAAVGKMNVTEERVDVTEVLTTVVEKLVQVSKVVPELRATEKIVQRTVMERVVVNTKAPKMAA